MYKSKFERRFLLLSLVCTFALSAAFSSTAAAAPPAGYCDVVVCNKLERFTLSPWSAIKDKMGQTCQPAILAEQDAVAGKELSANSRWYQGSFNLTKKSVNRVQEVKVCTPAAPTTPKA
jgi:hypothetical protein